LTLEGRPPMRAGYAIRSNRQAVASKSSKKGKIKINCRSQ